MNILYWKQEWFPDGIAPAYVLWEATWADSGVVPVTGAVNITGAVQVSGNLGYALTAAHNITQVGRINLVGSVALPPAAFGYSTFPFEIEGPLPISTIYQVLGIAGDLQYTVLTTDVPFNFNQVGAFTVRGLLTSSGGIEYTLRPDEPFDVLQVGGVALNGVVKVLGQLQSLRGFELATQPVAINGSFLFYAAIDYPFPSIINVLQVGEITLTGALALGSTSFRFDSFTEGLPNGWYVDGPILETVPNPNYGTAYGNAFFRRWTWKGYDPAGTQVAASGSEQDCIAQTLSVCQSRHQEDWHTLSR